jgi:hypothetical protein
VARISAAVGILADMGKGWHYGGILPPGKPRKHPVTQNQEPRTKNQEPRTKNQEHL